MMHNDLTGKFRYRTGWRGVLVLQVEVHQMDDDMYFMDRWYTKWRDATIQDLNVIEVKPIIKCEQ